ncbi:Phospholipase A2 like protein [Argiope bruennichi]|uniref:Phospholipase A2 n=1 Tax=Argiope bruennichi TaxID=94029 RepID=A0A8T0F2C3_ARGBR|nr:Phospholipase A2 like protein [Argiope bruennichi]
MYYYILVIISLDCFSSINSLPAISNENINVIKDGIYGDIRASLKNERYSGPKVAIETSSLDCSSSTPADCGINLLDETPNVAIESEVYLIDGMLKGGFEGLTTTPDPFVIEEHHESHFFIYPGTKWCGSGNIAVSYDDLGDEEETDKCCRIHDSCEDYMLGGETKFNLTNKSSFTSLSCECDEKLNECLRQANTRTSNLIGTLYFNILSRKCFTFDHPQKCKTQVTLLKLCSEYEPDTFAEKIYQWTSPKKFKTL